MTSWQRRARIGVATFGVACAAVVYFAFGGRRGAEAPDGLQPLPPRVVAVGKNGSQLQVTGSREDYVVEYQSFETYDDDSTKFIGVKITTKNRDDRDFVVTAREGRSTKNNDDVELAGDIRLQDSEGFELLTDRAMFNRATGLVSAAGPVSFSKGRMNGSGTGMTYDQHIDVLTVTDGSHITIRPEGDSGGVDFTAGSSVLDRVQDVLTLDRNVHVVNGEQITDADHATARLSPEDDRITFAELRGRAQVEGGEGPLRSMRARDIDLDYADDGRSLERAVLMGRGVAAMRGKDGAPGREFAGELLDVSVASDGSVTRMFGEGNVVMTLPAWAEAPSRVIEARTVEAKGTEGASLTEARFADHVVFREKAVDATHPRVVSSGILTLETSSSDAVASASFSNDVTFVEDDLSARAPDARYDPGRGMMSLTGKDAKGRPNVADSRVTVEADSIDIGLEMRHIEAFKRVKTSLRPQKRAAPAAGKRQVSSVENTGGLPGLLKQDQEAKVTAEAKLIYDGSKGTAVYSGGVWLWQGETEIKGDTIDINQNTGDLVARGSAHSTIVFETGRSEGRADEIQYVDADRAITYASKTPPRTPVGRGTVPEGPHVTGPQGDLRGGLIKVLLAETESRVQRIEASQDVIAKVDARTFTGKTLTYRADDETYHVTGTAAAPARMEERAENECRAAEGRTLTASRSADSIAIDGVSENRTQTRTSCATPASQ
jgi:LPS export ABC transporter protein LptC